VNFNQGNVILQLFEAVSSKNSSMLGVIVDLLEEYRLYQVEQQENRLENRRNGNGNVNHKHNHGNDDFDVDIQDHTNTTDTSSTDIMDATELEVLEHQFDDYIQQLPNTISISFAGLKSNELISIIQTELACSSGSACHSLTAGVSMSSVLQAMNISNSYGFGTLRISFGRYTTLEDVHKMVCIIINGINTLREMKMKE